MLKVFSLARRWRVRCATLLKQEGGLSQKSLYNFYSTDLQEELQELTSWSGWAPSAGRGRRAGTAHAPRPRTCASRSSCSSPSPGGSAPRGSRSSSPSLRREECQLSCIEVCDMEEFSLMICHNLHRVPASQTRGMQDKTERFRRHHDSCHELN